MAHRPGFSGWWGLVALAPLLAAVSGSDRLPRLVLAAGIAATGASFPMFEGVLPVLPWAFLPLVLAFVPQVLLPVLAWRRLGGHSGGPLAALSVAAAWLLCESVARAPLWGSLAGFYSLGYSQFDTALLGLARLSGPGLISFLLVFCGGALAQLRSRDFRALVACGLLAPPLLLLASPGPTAGPEFLNQQVTLVQPAFTSLEFALAMTDQEAAEAQARKLALLGSDSAPSLLMIWPETVLSPKVQPGFVTALLRADTQLITGRVETAGRRSYNSVMLPGESGWESVQRKVVPVPVIEWPQQSAGAAGGTLALPGLQVLGALVCLDSAHAWPALRAVRAGAELLVVLSNSEFAVAGHTPELHLRVSAFRAVELGVPVAFGASSGPSALIDPYGRVHARTRVGEQTALTLPVPDRLSSTPYLLAGDWFSWLASPVLLLLVPRVLRFPGSRGCGAERPGRSGRRARASGS